MSDKQPVILCVDCFIDLKEEVPSEFIIMGTGVCKMHVALRIRRQVHGNLPTRREGDTE